MLPGERTIIPHAITAQELFTLPSSASVRAAARAMTERRIGAIPVVDDGELVGIFTERDALARVLACELDPARTTLAAVMTRDPDTVTASTPISHALALMDEHRYRHLPVMQDRRLVGIISIRDMYRTVKAQMDADLLLLAETLIQG
jgi:CBS domain-containing protein